MRARPPRGEQILRLDLLLAATGDVNEAAISVEIPSCAVTVRLQARLPLFESKRNIRRPVLFRIKR